MPANEAPAREDDVASEAGDVLRATSGEPDVSLITKPEVPVQERTPDGLDSEVPHQVIDLTRGSADVDDGGLDEELDDEELDEDFDPASIAGLGGGFIGEGDVYGEDDGGDGDDDLSPFEDAQLPPQAGPRLPVRPGDPASGCAAARACRCVR